MPPSKPRRLFDGNPFFLALCLLSLAGVAQIFIVTAGWHGWPEYSDYYRRLTDSFLHGQVSLRTPPAPGLLALQDPYIPALNGRYRLHDAVLFDGKYYLYWGPVPALLAAVVCMICRISEPTFGDQYLVFIFLFATVVLATVLIFQIRAMLFPSLSPIVAAPAVLSLALGTPLLFMLARSAIYEAAISAGQCFLIAGLVAAWFALRRQRSWLLALAGFFWALSIGSRISLLPAVGVIALATLWFFPVRGAKKWSGALALMVPLIISLVLLGWYNFARFHSATEPGWRYQLSARPQHDVPVSTLASWRFILPDLVIYFFAPPYRIKLFPYFLAVNDWPTWEKALHLTRTFNFEATTGLLWSQPFLLFSICVLFASGCKNRPLEKWLIVSLSCGAFLGFAPPLMLAGVTMRYLVDIVPCCTILAALGYFQLYTRLAPHPRALRELRSAVRLIIAAQSVMGLLLGMTGYYNQFANFGAPIYNALRRFLPAMNF